MKITQKISLLLLAQYLIWLSPAVKPVMAQPAVNWSKSSSPDRLTDKNDENHLNALIPDFQVNENSGGSDKSSLALGADGNGNIVAAWSDSRDGYRRIYAQRFDRSGMPLGANFLVDDNAGNSEQSHCDIAVKQNGNFVITWFETNPPSAPYDEGNVFARIFDGSGTALGKTFKVTEETSLAFNPSCIAMDRSGNFMIVWQDQRLGSWDIFEQRYDSTGSPMGSNFKVNDESECPAQYPQIVALADGKFMVAWLDRQSDTSGIYAQHYDWMGMALGPNFLLAGIKGSVTDLALAVDQSGHVVVVWDEWQDDHRDLYGLVYNSPDSTLPATFIVNDQTLKRGFANQSVAVTPLGDFCVTWHGDEAGQDVIFARWFHRDGTASGSSQKVNEGFQVTYHVTPSIVTDTDGNYLLAWEDYRNEQPDLYAQRFDSFGKALGANFKMNDDVGSSDQIVPHIATYANGDFMVAWGDYREPSLPHFGLHSNIYIKRFNSSGAALGKDLKVNDDPMGNYIWNHKVAIAPSGQSVVVWYEYRKGNPNNSSWDVYAQFYSATGAPIGANILVSVDTGKVENRDPDVAVDAKGNFLLIWNSSSFDRLNFYRGIFARRFDHNGTPLGNGFKISNYTGGNVNAVAMTLTGEFMVVYDGVYAQLFDQAGNPQGTTIQVAQGDWPDITIDGQGDFFIVWCKREFEQSQSEIYARRYNISGSALGDEFKVNETSIGSIYPNYSVSSDQDGNVLVVWDDFRDGGYDIMAQRYDAQGQPVGNNFCPTQFTRLDQERPSAQVVNGKIYLAWQTNHVGGTGYDIWANVLDWSSPEKIAEEIDFRLWQNYPNPFNKATKIQYAVPEAGPTTIKIYNLSGRLVRVLLTETQSVGLHKIVWDGKDTHGQVMASGIYFCQLTSGQHLAVRRMVILR